MFVAELRWGGTWLDGLDEDDRRAACSLLQVLGHAVGDSAISLELFCRAQDADAILDDEIVARSDENRRHLMSRYQSLRAQMEESGWQVPEEAWELAALSVQREYYSAGRWPMDYVTAAPLLHGKSFMYSLERVRTTLRSMSKQSWAPAAIGPIYERFEAAFPDLKGLRDSCAHPEDRQLQRDQKGRRIRSKAVDNSFAEVGPGILWAVPGMHGSSTMHGTMASGHLGELAVTEETLRTALTIVQEVIDSFEWSGPVKWAPG